MSTQAKHHTGLTLLAARAATEKALAEIPFDGTDRPGFNTRPAIAHLEAALVMLKAMDAMFMYAPVDD